ncbi:MAG: hypothetical protein BWY76_03156 [bacterium ADurb.Bin429]|nr:MAG: hypothetical protein BWY76_03156 [bacterium ADurb.Bin429]
MELPGRVDYVLAGDGKQEIREGVLRFLGQGALVQPRPEGTRLTLFAGRLLAWEGLELEQPLSGGLIQAFFAQDGQLTGECDGLARTVTLRASAAFRGKKALYLDGQLMTRFPDNAGHYAFELPAGKHRFQIK